MAERRMFSLKIIDSDEFLEMPATARLLYYDLNMRADDDGFINAPKKITRITGASDGDMLCLFDKKFVIPFENGIVVIRHWKINNYIRHDRYHETFYKDEKKLLKVDENGIYNKSGIPNGNQTVTECQPNGSHMVDKLDTEVRLGKVRDRIGNINNYSSQVKKFSDDQAEMILAKHLFKLIKQNNNNAKEPNYQSWAKDIDLMIRIDKRDPKHIEKIMDLSQSDAFWMQNILSPAKLRKHFDQLTLKFGATEKNENIIRVGEHEYDLSNMFDNSR